MLNWLIFDHVRYLSGQFSDETSWNPLFLTLEKKIKTNYQQNQGIFPTHFQTRRCIEFGL